MATILTLATYRSKRLQAGDSASKNVETAKILLFDGVWQEPISEPLSLDQSTLQDTPPPAIAGGTR